MSREQETGIRTQRSGLMRTPQVIGFALLLGLSAVAATPLDDRIKAFKEAPTQTEGAVSQILQTGTKENRSAEAFAAVRSWLAANPTNSQSLLFNAGRAAEFGGEWEEAVGFYRKMLKADRPDGRLASIAVPSVYHLLINHLGDREAAETEGLLVHLDRDAVDLDRLLDRFGGERQQALLIGIAHHHHVGGDAVAEQLLGGLCEVEEHGVLV